MSYRPTGSKIMKIIKRISRLFALFAIYIIAAYGYLTAKGFIYSGNQFILSNQAYAQDESFSRKVSGDVGLRSERIRAQGNPNAPLTMYIYSSLACAHCRDFHRFILPKLQRDFISKGKLRFIFIHFPIDAMSMRAAKLSYCLPAERFYKFIDELYDKKDWLFAKDEEKLYAYARRFGMSAQGLEACKADKKLTSDILLVKDKAIETFNITGTPSFVIEGADGKEVILGTKSYGDLKAYLEQRLGAQR